MKTRIVGTGKFPNSRSGKLPRPYAALGSIEEQACPVATATGAPTLLSGSRGQMYPESRALARLTFIRQCAVKRLNDLAYYR